MWIKNVRIYTENQKFIPGAVQIRGERIVSVSLLDSLTDSAGFVSFSERDSMIDGQGCYLIPGMIDIHFHGCMGADFCDGTGSALRTIAAYEALVGVTAIAPATMTLPKDALLDALCNAARFRRAQKEKPDPGLADLVGINMEGPFISPDKKGAQDAAYILCRSSQVFQEFQQAAEGLVKLIAIAPEETAEESPAEFIANVSGSATVSLAHTNAGYDDAMDAFAHGASHAVHLFNAMTGLNHREPGTVGAVFDSPHVTAELICDGNHIHPAVIRTAFSALGSERIVLVSDSMRATGLSDGVYTLGGQDVEVCGSRAVLRKDGTLAGSVTNLPDCVRFAVSKVGIPLETAVACATINPAKKLGIDADYGTIAAGKYASLVLWDEDYRLKAVIHRGKVLSKGGSCLCRRDGGELYRLGHSS